MINFIKRKLRNLVHWATADDYPEAEYPMASTMKSSKKNTLSVTREIGDHRNCFNFTIQRASGGFIVEHSKYDRKRDENERSLHIIRDDEDLGDSVAKIITIEMLRN